MDSYQISFWCFTNLCSLFYYLFLMYCVSNTLAPQKTQTFLIEVGWASLKLYHSAKMKAEQFLKQQLENCLGKNYKQVFKQCQDIQLERTYYIKDGDETNILLNDADMVITYYHNLKSDENNIPVLINNEADSFSSVLIESKYCSYHFINIVLLNTNSENNIEINLFKPFNFYIDGNVILNKVFLEWYCNKYYQVKLNNNYKLQIIDDNANFINLDHNQGILLNKDNYTIISYSNNETIKNTLIEENKCSNPIIENININEADAVFSDSDNDNNNDKTLIEEANGLRRRTRYN